MNGEGPDLYCSLFAYAAYKRDGFEVGAEVAKGRASEWPGFRTVDNLRALCDVALQVDGSTLIAKARCRQSAIFLATGLPLWVSVDDDIEAGPDALAKLLEQTPEDGIVFAPYVARVGNGVHFGGFGLVCATRGAILRMVASYPSLVWDDDASGTRPTALFLESVIGGKWCGEDEMFVRRARQSGVPLKTLMGAEVVHNGRPFTCGLDAEGDVLGFYPPAESRPQDII